MKNRIPARILLLVFALRLLPVQAQTVYEKSPESHWPLWAAGELSMVGALLLDSRRPLPDASLLDQSHIFWPDRTFMPQPRTWASCLSDPLLLGSIAGGGLMALTADKTDWRTGAVVWAGTMIVTQGITQLTKVLARRPRPSAYRLAEEGSPLSRGEYQSFFSGHTSIAFASVVAGSVLWLNWRKSEWALPAASIAMAAGCGLTRIYSGRHFLTDVLTGAAVGAAMGILVPMSHEGEDAPKKNPQIMFHFRFAL